MGFGVLFRYFTVLFAYSISIVNCQSNGDGVFESTAYWDIVDKPVMANGHIGFIPYGDSIYMNGLYNGLKDNSHRARIPNFGNVQFELCSPAHFTAAIKCSYAMDIYRGLFRTSANPSDGEYSVEHIQYAHRYYDTAIVNYIKIKRNNKSNNPKNDTFQLRLLHSNDTTSDDITVRSTRSIKILDGLATIVEASANTVEDPLYQPKPAIVSILYEKIPDTVQLLPNENEANFIWITIVQSNGTDIVDEFRKIHENRNNLLAMHTNEWAKIWSEIQITAKGNKFLSNAIQASQFALVSSLPSLNRSRPILRQFYGISPAGLGLDRKQEVYNGHSFWDTEIWMQPSILLFEPEWSQQLLNYRHLMRHTAHENANNTGYQGFRYPWESAFTGIDVTPNAPEIIEYEQHITADIGHALRKHFLATNDFQWFRRIGCDLAYGTAKFWASRVHWNESSQRYDINGIMGPDEDHYNINNNAYTNVVAALNLHFGSFASCICHQLEPSKYSTNNTWATIAKRMTLLYDRKLDYNPQYDGYNLNITIKQADVTLLGYPLQFANLQSSTRRNNLHLYANLTRSNGPAMTWSMHAIGHLDIDSQPLPESMFNRTFVPYLRSPYFVWNENVNGVPYGAKNFITGAGGFLQLIMYGYAGIRINVDSLSVRKPQLPPNTTELKLNGISYMNARFEVAVGDSIAVVKILHGREKLNIFVNDVEQKATESTFTFGYDQEFVMKPSDQTYLGSCALPEDTVDPLNIN